MTTPPLVDSHCHLNSLDLSEFKGELSQVLAQARANGVQEMLCVCVEASDIPILYALAEKYKDIHISVGIHPTVEAPERLEASQLVEWAKHPACIAIGETGLDYFHCSDSALQQGQQQRFREHIRCALQTSKPLIIHTRDAAEDTLRLLAEENAQAIGGVMHCFSEDWAVAQRALDLNFYISFSGIVTFKSALQLQEVAKKVPSDRMLIETDAPYLAPVPFRGRQNHPALVKHVAEKLSELRQVDFASIAEQTTANFKRCFRLE